MKYITAIICALIIWWALLLVQDNKQDSIERQVKAKIELEQNKLDMEQTQIDKEDERLEQARIKKETNKILLESCLYTAEEDYYAYAELNWTKDENGIIEAQTIYWETAKKNQKIDNDICFKKYK